MGCSFFYYLGRRCAPVHRRAQPCPEDIGHWLFVQSWISSFIAPAFHLYELLDEQEEAIELWEP
jgi:hypothetical protein